MHRLTPVAAGLLALSGTSVAHSQEIAQATPRPAAPAASSASQSLAPVNIEGKRGFGAAPSLAKLPTDVRDIPQSIVVVDKALMQSVGKFVVSGVVLSAAFWFSARFATVQLAQLSALRDEAALSLLIVVGIIVYAGLILLLFGRGWLRSLVRS